MRSSERASPPGGGIAPPVVPVPRPRGQTAIRCSAQAVMIAATSAVSSGKATAAGKDRPRLLS